MPVRLAVTALSCTLVLFACKSDDPGPTPTAAISVERSEVPEPDAAADTVARTIRYDDSTAGLEALFADLRRALDQGDDGELALLLDSLRLRGYEAWFDRVFGKRLGGRLARDYRPQFEEIGMLRGVLAERLEDGQTRVEVERFDRPRSPGATGYQNAALERMKKKPVPLYSLRLSSAGGATFHLWSLIHEGGTFRYVGKMKPVASADDSGDRDLLELRLRDAERARAAR